MPPILSPVVGDNGARGVKLVTDFIHQQLKIHRQKWSSSESVPPLFVGVQGPQGSGKSHLVAQLPPSLSPLRTASLSLDDLYLPHSRLFSLAKSDPGNKLIQGRGQPGTHDLDLAISIFSSLSKLNSDEVNSSAVELPIFDKSLHSGEGDRSSETVKVEGPIDVVLFEGWCLGFHSLLPSQLSGIYRMGADDPTTYAKENLDYDEPFFVQHELDDLVFINEKLKGYEQTLWKALDCFVQIEPKGMGYVWKWRLEQEHNMKAKNGGKGMTDDQVKQFISRYMPSYELFQKGIQNEDARWRGRGLKLVQGMQREIVATEAF